jgi:hypothetical protein
LDRISRLGLVTCAVAAVDASWVEADDVEALECDAQ